MQASGDLLQSTLTGDDDTRNLLTPGVDLNPSLLTNEMDNHRKTIGKIRSDKLPDKHSSVGIIPNEQDRRGFDTRGCQNSSFSSTQDVLKILTGRLIDDEQNGRRPDK